MPKGLSPVFPPRRPSSVVRYLIAIVLVIIILYAFNHRLPEGSSPYIERPDEPTDSKGKGHASDTVKSGQSGDIDDGSIIPDPPSPGPDDSHPIGKLIYDAQHVYAELMSKESHTIEDAAQAYRKRRGRHPPPGFDRWFEFAQEKKSVIVEDFFDQVYHDLEPFWGIEPTVLRKASWDFEMTINVRNGEAKSGSDWFWTVIWLDLIKTVEHLLPDMDLALNAMDEPRLVVPWEDINELMRKAKKTRKLPKAKDVRSDSQKLPEPGKGDVLTWTQPKNWENTSRST
jgi:hypothetical protein